MIWYIGICIYVNIINTLAMNKLNCKNVIKTKSVARIAFKIIDKLLYCYLIANF